MPDLSVAIVSYNTADRLRECLSALQATRGVTLEATVVDNASNDGSADVVASEFPEVLLIRNHENRGFAAATNQVMARASGRYVLLLNPDAVVSPTGLAEMTRFMDTHVDAAICGPRLMLADGTLQSCGCAFPTVVSMLRQMRTIDRIFRWFERGPRRGLPAEPFECDWVEGACLMIRRSVVNRIGFLDERFFLYAEEMDWCHAARADGWHVYAHPGVSVLHYRGESTRQRELEALTLLVQTKLMYFHKRRGTAIAALVGAICAAGFLKQLPVDELRAKAKLRGVGRWVSSVGRWR